MVSLTSLKQQLLMAGTRDSHSPVDSAQQGNSPRTPLTRWSAFCLHGLTLVQQSPAEAEEHGDHHSELNASCRKPFAVTVPKWHQVANEHTYMVFLKYFCISLHRNNTCLKRAPGYLHFCAEKQQFSNSRSPVGRIDEFKFKQHLTCITSEKIPIFL